MSKHQRNDDETGMSRSHRQKVVRRSDVSSDDDEPPLPPRGPVTRSDVSSDDDEPPLPPRGLVTRSDVSSDDDEPPLPPRGPVTRSDVSSSDDEEQNDSDDDDDDDDHERVQCVDPSDEVKIISTRTRLQRHLNQLSVIESISAHVKPYDLPNDNDGDMRFMDMPTKLQLLYQHTYDRLAYGAWPAETPFPKVYEQFTYCGHSYVIKPSEYIHGGGLGLHIMSSTVVVPPGNTIAAEPLMPFCGPIYTATVWRQLAGYFFSMSRYGLCANAGSDPPPKISKRLYIDGRPKTHGNIAGYINSRVGTEFLPNCEFHECSNNKEEFMGRHMSSYVVVVPIRTLKPGDELISSYNYWRPTPRRKRRLDSGESNVIIKPGPKLKNKNN